MDFLRAMEHAKRKTLTVGDLILVICLRGYVEPILQDWKPLPDSVNRERGRTRN